MVARELLLRGPINDALAGEGLIPLDQMLESSESAWIVIEDTPFLDWASTDQVRLAKAARSLMDSDLPRKYHDRAELKTTFAKLHAAFEAVDAWVNVDAVVADGLSAMFEMAQDPHLVNRSMVAWSETTREGPQLDSWIDNTVAILNKLEELGLTGQLADGVRLPASGRSQFVSTLLGAAGIAKLHPQVETYSPLPTSPCR